MNILIIGGTGFMGPHIARQLDSLGHRVTLFHRGRTQADLPPSIQHILGDRRQLAEFTDELQKLAPQLVLDMIPFCEQDAIELMTIFRHVAQRVVAISSQDVYQAYGRLIGRETGPAITGPQTEDAPLRQQLYPYRSNPLREPDDPQKWLDDYDKILVEQIVMGDADLPGTVLRLPMVYGPGDRQHRLYEYLKRMDDQRPAILLEEGLAQWCGVRGYVEDVGAAVVLASTDERAVGRIYNVGEPEAPSTAEWVRRIAQAAGWSGQVITLPSNEMPEHLVPKINTEHQMIMDCSRIRNELGFAETISWEEALQRTIAWERANPPDQVDPTQFDYEAENQVPTKID